ncbi:MFS transporter [Mycobacteroides abscessus subsp. abscessus]|uniref:MFS transporter n=1 Tax=Mycobacteroides abscessus TaxID=36809 RepID=UPI0019D04151|nr:MFS transporter [Mycobacteroides abscessus]MBN7438722.1 MFS transporter [Mycobacteroides abscessus subsp. abscessus]
MRHAEEPTDDCETGQEREKVTDLAATADVPHLNAAQRWLALGVLSLALAVIIMDMTILNVALPHITAALGATAVQQLWIVDVYALALAGLLVPMSTLADRYGRKRILLVGLLVFGGASLAVLGAVTTAHVIALRALLGAGGAMIIPMTLSMIRVIFTDSRQRAVALGLWAAVTSVAAALGPLVGGALLQYGPWQHAFLINVPIMAIALIFGSILLPESSIPAPPRWDSLGMLASLVGMVALVWAIKDFAAKGPADLVAWTVLGAALFALSWFARRCLIRPDPILELRLFGSTAFTAGILTAFGAMYALGALMLLIIQWLELAEGLTPLQAGLALLPATIVMGVVSPLAPPLANRIGERVVLGGGLITAALSFLVIFLAPSPLSYGWVAAALCLLGVGVGTVAVASTIIMSEAPLASIGSAAALEEISYELGSVLGVAVLGSVASAMYRSHLDGSALAGLSPTQAQAARESISGAMQVVASTGSSRLILGASKAFTNSLTQTSLIGLLTVTAIAAAVILLMPRHYKLHKKDA